MGIIFSRFRKQPTTLEQLRKIEDGLRKIEDYKRTTEQKQKRTVANLVIYGVALYILACVIVFVWYLPESWLVRLALLVPLVLVPLFIYLMKRLISRYFESKMVRANEDYADLQRKKKDLIDSVMETETFNKAKEILTRYAPEKLEKKEAVASSEKVAVKSSSTDLRKRNTTCENTSTINQQWLKPVGAPAWKSSAIVPSSMFEPKPTQNRTNLLPQLSLPQPLFSKDRSLGDKLVEYIVGDGPSYRYALICKFCREHNGMALQEEFPYMSFLCCYCRKFNPARITRPSAPRLPENENLRKILDTRATKTLVMPDARLPISLPFDKYLDQALQQSQDTDESSGDVPALNDRISDNLPNEKLESSEHLTEYGDTSSNSVGNPDEGPRTMNEKECIPKSLETSSGPENSALKNSQTAVITEENQEKSDKLLQAVA